MAKEGHLPLMTATDGCVRQVYGLPVCDSFLNASLLAGNLSRVAFRLGRQESSR